MVLDQKFKVHLSKAIDYNAKGKSFNLSSSPRHKTKKKSNHFSKLSKQKQQRVVSKITKNFTTPTVFKKRHFSKPFFRKKHTKKAILKKYRKFGEKGNTLDFSCKNRTLVKIKKESQPLKPKKTFSRKKKRLTFNEIEKSEKTHRSAFLRKKSSFPRKLSKHKKPRFFKTPVTKPVTT